ncbi:hypothetical protein Tco_0556182 [Tanacetum coccineum]
MASPKASISKPSKKPKFTIIPPKQLFIDLTNEDTITPSPKLHESSPSAPNAPSKTPSTKDTSSSSIDYTLFTKKKDSNLIIVQIYVDDIIFGSTCQEMCDDFAKIMHDEFEMRIYIETIVYAIPDPMRKLTLDRKSTSGVCTFMGCCLTSWFSKKQTALAISTTKAEYVSAEKACQQALWMKQALIDYGVRLDDILIMCDNKGAIDLSKNPVQHSRTKHIEIRHHFLRDNVQKGNISIEKVSSEDNIADILTKPLKREPFNYLRLGLGMMEQID